jgi:hypothetical protein
MTNRSWTRKDVETTTDLKRGGELMQLEIVESGGCAEEPVAMVGGGIEPMGCPEGGFIVGCCIIHFWCWEPGHGLCC